MDFAMSRRAVLPFILAAGLACAGAANAASVSFKVPLSGAQCVPPVETSGTGTADLTYDPATRVVTWNITYSGLSSPVTMAHFHGPGQAGQEWPGRDLAHRAGQAARKPDNGKRYAHSRAGAAIHRRRVVCERAHAVPSSGRDPRTGDPAQELTAITLGWRGWPRPRRRRRREALPGPGSPCAARERFPEEPLSR